MLGLAEVTVGLRDLFTAASKAESQIAAEMPFANRQEALRIAQFYSDIYYEQYRNNILRDTLTDVGENALNYYQNQLGIDVDDFDETVRGIVDKQFKEKYYGATLEDRLKVNAKRLSRNIIRSAAIGQGFEYVSRVLTKPIPYGSQYNIDKRIIQATAVKIEQDIARYAANKAGARLVKWNISSYHSKPDICDEYATYVDKGVVQYIEENNLGISPRGVYFIDQLPYPPHPNCRCEYGIVIGRSDPVRGIVRRSADKLASIINRLRRK